MGVIQEFWTKKQAQDYIDYWTRGYKTMTTYNEARKKCNEFLIS